MTSDKNVEKPKVELFLLFKVKGYKIRTNFETSPPKPATWEFKNERFFGPKKGISQPKEICL